ncbi:MAG: hypothetical protein RL216_1462 [Pseudomonadota bacterium]|jgi:hypothetical protein
MVRLSKRAAIGGVSRPVLSILLVATCLGLGTSAAALEIRRDMGGPVAERVAMIAALERSQTTVRIAGLCVSACTMLLGLRRTCVEPEARLGFHGPSGSLAGVPLPRAEFERVSRLIAGHYPPALRAWFMTEARMRTASYVTISGAEAIRMGARACD